MEPVWPTLEAVKRAVELVPSRLDLDGLARNVAEMTRYPFCALVAAGGTGELYSLTTDEIVDVVRVTVEATAGKMPVVAEADHWKYGR